MTAGSIKADNTAEVSRFGSGFLINPEAPPGHIEAKWPDPDLGSEMLDDNEKYFSPEYLGREWKGLWSRCWNIAGRVSDVAVPGDYFRFDLGRESFIVTRARDDVIRAFYNVCPHRGARIVTQDFGNAANLVCGFHAWSWNLDGTLRTITDRETFSDNLVCDNPGLVEVRCDTWGGFVFINLDPDAQSLEEFLGVLPEHLAPFHFDEFIVMSEITVEWNANWKLALDAFMEGYHIQIRHPEALGYIDDYHCQRDMFPNGHGRLIFPVGLRSPRASNRKKLAPEVAEMLRDVHLDPADFENRADEARPALQKAKRQWAQRFGMNYDRFTDSQLSDDWNYSIFPNVTFNIHCDNALMMRFRPHPTDPEKCLYDIIVLALKVNDPGYRLPAYMGLPDNVDLSGSAPRPERIYLNHEQADLGLVLNQDAAMVPYVQKGVQSEVFRGVRLSEQEIRIRHFYREYQRYLDGIREGKGT